MLLGNRSLEAFEIKTCDHTQRSFSLPGMTLRMGLPLGGKANMNPAASAFWIVRPWSNSSFRPISNRLVTSISSFGHHVRAGLTSAK
jgi:hypothetical protein